MFLFQLGVSLKKRLLFTLIKDANGSHIMRAAFILTLLVALALGAAAYYYYDLYQKSQAEIAALGEAKEQQAALAGELEAKVDEIARQKEEELAKLKGTYDKLVGDMKNEIQQGNIKITQLADGLSVSMADKILFPSGEADLKPEGVEILQRVGKVLKNAEDKIIRVEGHTDSFRIAGDLKKQFPTNWELSTARATNVVRFLQDKAGIEGQRLQAVGMSQYHPVASNKKEAGRSQNRRIEIKLLPRIKTQ